MRLAEMSKGADQLSQIIEYAYEIQFHWCCELYLSIGRRHPRASKEDDDEHEATEQSLVVYVQVYFLATE